jgi:pyridoxine 4-dehydrogenase
LTSSSSVTPAVEPRSRLDDTSPGMITIGDLRVRRLGFGAMRISGARDAAGTRSRDEAIALTRRVYDRGVTFFDTANIYGYGESEEIIAEALHPYPDDLVIASKAGFRPGKILPGHATLPPNGDPAHVKAECEKSLQRLRREVIDVFQIHTPDPSIPFADTVGGFVELQQEGKIRHIGLCNVSLAQVELAQTMCEVVSVQNRYNAADRIYEPLLSACEASGMAFLPWQPIDLPAGAAQREVAAVAAERGLPVRHVALAWLFRRSPVILPIPGTSSISHLDDNVDAAWATITDADFERIDRATSF